MAVLNPRLADLCDDDRQVVESWLVGFDQGWDEGLLANRLDQIPPGSSWRLPALAEMVKIDLERHWGRGRQISLESYLAEFPELGSPGDVSADLIQAEYEVRRQFGAPLALEDYLRRFPHQAGELARLIAQGGSALWRRSSAADPSSSPVQKFAKTPAEVPEQFGRYRIIKRLGQGGMGSVYLAQDTHLQRPVALKVPDFGKHEDTEARKRFLEEARTAATLDHPYICPVYDAGEIDGQLYLTMAYIEGQSLAELIGEEGWPRRQAGALVGKLALALQEAHTRKVIHRDLKPANVMIKTTGQRREPVIVDFGLARRETPQDQRLTRSGQVMGTLSYMSPEQIRADLKQIGPASDIYALGVILYELLTGRLPFNGSGLEVAGLILTQTPLPPSTHRSDLDPALEAICLKAMARTIGDRYTSMAELAAALTGFLQSPSASPATAAPAGSPATPSLTKGEQPRPAESNSPVGQFLAQLAGTQASYSPILSPEPFASGLPLHKRRRPMWPMIVVAGVLGVMVLFVVNHVATDSARVKKNVGDHGVIATGADKPPARARANKPPVPEVFTSKGRIDSEVNDPRGVAGKGPGRPDPASDGTHGLAQSPAQTVVAEPAAKTVESRSVEKLSATVTGPARSIEGKPPGPLAAGAAESPARTPPDKPAVPPAHLQIPTDVPVPRKAIPNSIGMRLMLIPSGEFLMGSPDLDQDAANDEKPPHRVRITRPFYLGVYEVTQRQYRLVTGAAPSSFKGPDDLPVDQVSWNDAIAICNKRSEMESLKPCYEIGGGLRLGVEGYRLPTEAEWEYACRAGSTTKYAFGDETARLGWFAWYHGNSASRTHPVGRKRPNAWGLYDMYGNVFEWCGDWYDEDYYRHSPGTDPPGPPQGAERVVRGGGWSWGSLALRACRSASRRKETPTKPYFNRGFRVARHWLVP